MPDAPAYEHSDDPSRLPSWPDLSASRTFYCGADWLRFADSDGLSRSHYLTVPGTAALSAHWAPKEVNGGYLPARMLPGTDGAPALVLGGRRGYLSAPLLERSEETAGTDRALDLLLGAALEREPQAEGRWWWPYLPGEDAARVLRAFAPRGPLTTRLVGADCVLDVPDGGREEYLAALPAKQRRTNVRREMRRYAESGLRTERGRLSDWAGTLGPMLSQVQHKYGHDHSPAQMTDLLRRQARHLDELSVVFMAFAEDSTVPVAFCLAYRHGDELSVRVVGFDYDRLPGAVGTLPRPGGDSSRSGTSAGEYAQLAVHEPVRYCQENGLRRLHLGTGSYEAKCRRGARVRPLWAVASFGAPSGSGITEQAPGAPSAADIAPGLPEREARLLSTRMSVEHGELTRLTAR